MGEYTFTLGREENGTPEDVIRVTVNRREASAKISNILTSGTRGVEAVFAFSADWEDLRKIVVFVAGDTKIDFELTENSCTVPPDVLAVPKTYLRIGVYGVDQSGDRVTPTVYADVCRIEQGAEPSGNTPGEKTKPLILRIMEAAEAALASALGALETAQSVRDEAEAGAFDGAAGADGNSIWWTNAKVYASGDVAQVQRRRLQGRDGTPAVHDLVIASPIGEEGAPSYLYEITVSAVLCTLQPIGSLQGEPGSPGAPGFAPVVTIETIPGGHRVTITSAAHPEGQSVDILNGSGGGVTVDDELSDSSENPVQNKVLKAALDGKLGTSGAGSDVTVAFTAAAQRTAIGTGEKLSALFGKIGNWLSDLGTAAFKAATDSISQNSHDLIESGAVFSALANKYEKPENGIPGTDLAETYLTAHQSLSAYRTAEAQDLIDRQLAAAIPTRTSDLQNDSGFLTAHQSLSAYRTAEAQDLIDQQIAAGIPTKTSDLQNDSGFLTQHQDISGKLDAAQGTANAGKFLVVGSDGLITTVSMTAWQGGNY